MHRAFGNAPPTKARTRESLRRRFSDFTPKEKVGVTVFKINTCKNVSKQTTLTPFRMNTYENHRGGDRDLVNADPTESGLCRGRGLPRPASTTAHCLLRSKTRPRIFPHSAQPCGHCLRRHPTDSPPITRHLTYLLAMARENDSRELGRRLVAIQSKR